MLGTRDWVNFALFRCHHTQVSKQESVSLHDATKCQVC